jgi:hypothetical protein
MRHLITINGENLSYTIKFVPRIIFNVHNRIVSLLTTLKNYLNCPAFNSASCKSRERLIATPVVNKHKPISINLKKKSSANASIIKTSVADFL